MTELFQVPPLAMALATAFMLVWVLKTMVEKRRNGNGEPHERHYLLSELMAARERLAHIEADNRNQRERNVSFKREEEKMRDRLTEIERVHERWGEHLVAGK